VLVVNRTRVVPARLFADRADGVRFEVFFLPHHRCASSSVRGQKPERKLRPGDILDVVGAVAWKFVERKDGREAVFSVFDGTVDELLESERSRAASSLYPSRRL
jgi:S-adenosylmethionine:tRNA ribosyltransferase-isomerase